jgi:type II secretory pathway pseudopilin PulG
MSATGRPAAQAGTTLIEALVAVALIGLVAMVAFPRLQQSILGVAQRQSVAAVSAGLSETRGEALRADRPRVFAVSDDGRRYGSAGRGFAALPPGVELSGARLIVFYGDGSSRGGQMVVAGGSRATRLIVSAATGNVVEYGG